MTATRPDFYDLVAKNRRRTWLLMTGFFLLLVAVGISVSLMLGGGIVAVVIAVILSVGLTFGAYYKSDTIALRSTRARPADPSEFSRLVNLVEEVSIAAGIPPPRVYVVDDPAPNAFATGRNVEHAAVAVTTGLLDKLNRVELEGVIAHEIAHIRNGDILVMTVAASTAGSIAMISDVFFRMLFYGAIMGGGASHRRSSNNSKGGGGNPIALIGMVVVVVLAPLAAALLRAAVSRTRESLADATAVEFTRYPTGLRQALEKLDADITVLRHTSHATSHLWIESPDNTSADAKGHRLNGLFDTHPPLADRINLLRAMEGIEPYTGPDADMAERIRTMQDDRAVTSRGVASLVDGSGAASNAAASVDMEAIFAGSGEVADSDTDPDHPHAGWYAAPSGEPGVLRYWNGHAWTDHHHVIPDGNHLVPDRARG